MNLDHVYAAVPPLVRNRLKRIMMFVLKRKLKYFYRQFIKPDQLVFDIGANDGDYTEIFKELGGKVISVDPQPISIKKLQKRFAKKQQITILPYGVGDKPGKLNFYISNFNNPNSSFSQTFRNNSRYSYRKWDAIIEADMTTLHHLIQTYGVPHFCKIDVEGYEWEVISTLKKPIPALSFEFMTELNDKTFRIIKHLDTLGDAQYNFCLGMTYKFQLRNWITGKEMITLLKNNQLKMLNGDIYVKYSAT